MLGVCSATLRDLDRSGIVRPKRTAAGHRFYSTDDLRTLAAVLHRHLPDGVLV
jgi:DNA-binding transcriptional MerR regulator